MYVEDRECGSIVDMTFRGDSHLKSKRKMLTEMEESREDRKENQQGFVVILQWERYKIVYFCCHLP